MRAYRQEQDVDEWNAEKDNDVVLLDALTEEHLNKIGEWMEVSQKNVACLFSVGSSGIEMALGNHWRNEKVLQPVNQWPDVNEARPLLAVSGSCSPVTAMQIEYAKRHGFEEVIIDISGHDERLEKIVQEVTALLQQQKDVVVHTGKKEKENLSSDLVGKFLGTIAKKSIERASIKRIIVAGGDTSSYAGRAMEIEALEMIAPFVSGAPLCKVHSKNKSMDGIEINLKGGQVGAEDYFVLLKQGIKTKAMIETE